MADNAETTTAARRTKSGSTIDLDAMSIEELTALITAADSKRREKQATARAVLMAEFREKAALIGISLDELLPSTRKPTTRKQHLSTNKLPIKFRNDETGEQWSGRGREPLWIKGKDRMAFAVSE